MILAQLLAYPIGRFLAQILPTRTFQQFGNRWQFSLNPVPFTIKEHCIIATMAGTADVRYEEKQRTFFIHNFVELCFGHECYCCSKCVL